MPLSTRTITIVAGLISVPIFGSAVIGANYLYPVHDHLEDIVQGANTTVVDALNAPNWAYAIPLATPVSKTIATTTGGTLASSTPIYIQVAALDGNGTTTLSSVLNVTTDASTTLLGAEAINVSWSAVTGAAAYAVYFGTTTSGVPNTSFYLATTTSGQLTGTYTKANSTAFSVLVSPLGASRLGSGGLTMNGALLVSTSTAASTTAAEINGNVRAQSNGTTTSCYAATAGNVFYNTANSHEWGCNGTSWKVIF